MTGSKMADPDTLLSPAETLPTDKLTFKHVSDEQVLQLLSLLEDGDSVRAAALKLGMNRRTAFRLAAKFDIDIESARKLMQAKALDRIEDWEDASTKAASKGDHRPAKDWLLHAKVIDPVEDSSTARTQVAILIGTPDAPIRVDAPQVIDMQAVSLGESGTPERKP
jgi:hypothetical protein